jgi:hypothetical protein
VVNLPQAINDDANLIKACGNALEKIFKPNLRNRQMNHI